MMEIEERPVADRIEGVATPAECRHVIGHDAAMEKLTGSYRSGRLHHAWLLSGPRGIGKASFAFNFAKYVFSHPDPATAAELYDPESIPETIHRQVAQGGHPELLHLTRPWDEKGKRFKTQLSVEEVRRTLSFYGMTAGAGGWRITIVDAADDMNASAANALLKILEEPPKRSLFFVITHAAGGLLPTIRSRCQLLPMHPLAPEDVSTVLDGMDVQASDNDRQRAAVLSEGSVRRAIQLMRGEVLAEYASFESLMKANAKGDGTDWVAAHKIAESVSRRGQEDAYLLFIDLVTGWIGQQVRANAQSSPEALAGWAEVWDKASRSVALADAFNLDKKQVILSLFGSLFERNKP